MEKAPLRNQQYLQHPVRDFTDKEISRQVVHMLVGTLALLLRWLNYPLALGCAAAAVGFNFFILPKLPGSKRFLYRAEEQVRGFSCGILLYPVSVFILIFAFPVPVAASMWGMLSFGDGMATVVGSRVGRRPLPWNRKKSVEGLLAFVFTASPVVAFLYWWTLPNISSSPLWWRFQEAISLFGSPGALTIVIVVLLTVFFCGFLETLKLRIDDNLVVPLGGACVMVGLLYVFRG